MISNNACFILSLLAVSTTAFTTPAAVSRQRQQQPSVTTTTSRKAIALDWEQDDDAFLLMRAMDCADSDSCSLDEAEHYLESILHAESGCASGALIGSNICDNVSDAAEAVANLRLKIERESKRLLAVNASASVVNAALALAIVSAVVAGSTHVNPGVEPFTPQEIWWSIRDGYFPLMVQSYFRDGGLATIDYSPETTPFALQEWYWSIRDGYFFTMVEHYFRHGGLSAGTEVASVGGGFASVPFTPQEISWAIKGGYLDKVVSDVVQTGGLSGVESGSDVVPFTGQEIFWAAKYGYLQEMADAYFRNGGL